MAKDQSLALRQAVVTWLMAGTGLTALAPADRIFGEQPVALPAWPFVRYGEDDIVPLRAQCWHGREPRSRVCAILANSRASLEIPRRSPRWANWTAPVTARAR